MRPRNFLSENTLIEFSLQCGTIPHVLFTIKYVWYANDELVPQKYDIQILSKMKNFKIRYLVYLSSLYLAQLPLGHCPFKHTYNIHYVRGRVRRMFFK